MGGEGEEVGKGEGETERERGGERMFSFVVNLDRGLVLPIIASWPESEMLSFHFSSQIKHILQSA